MKVLVVSRPGRSQEVFTLLKNMGLTGIEYHEFISTYVVDLPIDAVSNVAASPAVTYVGSGDYDNIVKGVEWVIQKKAEFQVCVINLSLGPMPPYSAKPFVKDDPVNLATRRASENGIVVVVAAGNGGPSEGTLNPWSVAPWVVGVGAATNETTLAEFSSRGEPGDLLHVPTIVAIGANLIDEFDKEPLEGTSFAAPQVTFLAIACIEFIESIQSSLVLLERATPSLVIGNEHNIAILDSGVDPNRLVRRNRVRGGRAHVLSEPLRDKLTTLREFLRTKIIPYSVTVTPDRVKRMLIAMAKPMARMPYEVGAGFVDQNTATIYFARFGAREFVSMFALRELTRQEERELAQLEQQLGPLNSEQEVEMIFTYCELGYGFVSVRVV